jgi:exonuclease VII small subunit
MESQTGENMLALTESMERMEARIEAAAALFERAAVLIEERQGDVQKIVAAVETSREAELRTKLEAAELQIAELRAQIESRPESKPEAQPQAARRTVPATTAQFLAKQGISSLESLEAGTLDAALHGLSLEQRIAVKAQLLRAGVVS